MNIAFIGAHQDDEMFCLGTLLKYNEEKRHSFSFIYLTNGDKGISDDPNADHAATAKLRAAESRRVADEFKASLDILDNPDEGLFDSYENRMATLELLRQHKVDLIFTHYTSEYNLDHNITSNIVFQAALLANIASIRTQSPALKSDPRIFYVYPGEGYGFEPTHFVEIPEHLVEETLRIMWHHQSQMDVSIRMQIDYPAVFRNRFRRVGERVGLPYAECFRPCLADRRTPLANMLPA
jgi:LmbE family N-acetylglucosaminyl deacetylase